MFDSASAGRYGRLDVTPDTVAPLYFLAASLLLVSGVLKLVGPRATAQAMLDAGLPGSRAVARGLGAGECAAAAFAAAAPARGGALALAIVYLAFAGFVGYVLRTHPTAGSCGCAGSKAVPPSLLHLALDVAAAATGLLYLVARGPSATAWFVALGWGSVPVIAGLALRWMARRRRRDGGACAPGARGRRRWANLPRPTRTATSSRRTRCRSRGSDRAIRASGRVWERTPEPPDEHDPGSRDPDGPDPARSAEPSAAGPKLPPARTPRACRECVLGRPGPLRDPPR